jgi:hypothetical protein
MSNNKIYLPYEIKLKILSYLSYTEVAQINNSRHIYYRLCKHIDVPIVYKEGAFNNINGGCFYCNEKLGSSYNINMCICIKAMEPLELTFKYPCVCSNCTKDISRGNQYRVICKCCGNYSMHIGITSFS